MAAINYKGYSITDGNHEMTVRAESRNKATGVFLARYGDRCDWARLRTRRAPEIDGDHPWSFDVGTFCTVEYWGATVSMP